MNTIVRKSLLIVLTAFISLLRVSAQENALSEDKAHILLREIGHKVLYIHGDSTTHIPPIKKIEENLFRLQLDTRLLYDTLPFVIDQVMEAHSIYHGYQVFLRDCESDETVLAYHFLAFKRGETTCVGRDQESICTYLDIHFSPLSEVVSKPPYIVLSLASMGFIALLYLLIGRRQKEEGEDHESENNNHIVLGKFNYMPDEQRLQFGSERIELTFRENKLLLLFSHNIHKVLPRETILDKVWGDEGVQVGRSLDVFVSRLRKILKNDPSIQIKSIHGVGYRLELER